MLSCYYWELLDKAPKGLIIFNTLKRIYYQNIGQFDKFHKYIFFIFIYFWMSLPVAAVTRAPSYGHVFLLHSNESLFAGS